MRIDSLMDLVWFKAVIGYVMGMLHLMGMMNY
jgi:hypothetical protein